MNFSHLVTNNTLHGQLTTEHSLTIVYYFFMSWTTSWKICSPWRQATAVSFCL